MPGKPVIAVVLTGGTIDSVGASRVDLAWYFEHGERLGPGQLIGAVPELADVAEIREVSFRRVPSQALQDADLIELAQLISELVANEAVDGVVLVVGTNTLEEIAYFVHLTLHSDKPVVVTGAMRPSSALGADGYLNLLRAAQVAASFDAKSQGCLVVLNDTVFSARDVTKTLTSRVETFQAPDLGPLGYADSDGRVVFYHRHLRLPTAVDRFAPEGLVDLPSVDVILSYGGADAHFYEASVAAGAHGIVSAGTGAGRSTPAEEEAQDRAIEQGVVICQSSRAGAGRVTRSPSMRRRGIVAADNLQPWKARVLLALCLTRTSDPDSIQRLFEVL